MIELAFLSIFNLCHVNSLIQGFLPVRRGVLSLDVPEDPEPSELIDSTPEVHYAGRVDGSRAVSQKLEFLYDATEEWLTSSASRTGSPRD